MPIEMTSEKESDYTATSRIAILMATYNGEKYIEQQFDSILGQSCNNWHVFISDDCSTDATREIIAEYCNKYRDRFTDLQNKRRFGNARDHFLHLIYSIDSEYYMLADQDDVWMPDKIRISNALMHRIEQDHPTEPILVHSDLEVVDEKLMRLSSSFVKSSKLQPNKCTLYTQLIQNCVTGCTTMFNAALRELVVSTTVKTGSESPILMHDWWLGLIASCFGIIAFMDEPTVKYRQHGSNSVGAVNVNSIPYLIQRALRGGVRKTIFDTRKQADYFCMLYSSRLPDETVKIFQDLAASANMSKVRRIRFYIKSGILKQGAIRRVVQFLLG